MGFKCLLLSEGVHYIISNFADLSFVCDIRIFVDNEVKIDQIASDSEMIYYMDE